MLYNCDRAEILGRSDTLDLGEGTLHLGSQGISSPAILERHGSAQAQRLLRTNL
jgi:hypothetical protein